LISGSCDKSFLLLFFKKEPAIVVYYSIRLSAARPSPSLLHVAALGCCTAAKAPHLLRACESCKFVLQIDTVDGHHPPTMRPFIGVSCCIKIFGPAGSAPLPNHAASDAAVRAAAEAACGVPLLVPALGEADINCLLDRLDGILLTGSRSMVSPCHYGGPPHADGVPEDTSRDATTLPLIRAALARGIPVLAICRGLQELNVALGGTLHQDLAGLPGRLDHRAPVTEDVAVRFGKAHDIAFTSGGVLHRLAGAPTARVNSLHHQGIAHLAPGLAVEAVAPDGTIEAVRLVSGPGWALGVQWHPEADWRSDSLSRRIFEAFGDAVRGPAQMAMAAD